jgi:hypothetical protein
MKFSHQPSRSILQTERLRRQQGGYVLVSFALLLIPLLLIAGLSVDVGGWYSRASNIQKATDAAALAGVVWLPNVGLARQYAKEAAKRNGFEDGVNNVTVTVDAIGDRRLRVTIEDSKVGSTFWQGLTKKTIALKRAAYAEYVLPVPLGSPDWHFGNDPTDTTFTQPNLWGNIHGPRTDNNKGDQYAAGCRGSDNCGSYTNPNYRPEGYLYTIDVPTGGVSSMNVQIYDAGIYNRGDETLETGDTAYTGTGSTSTTWTFYNMDSTPLDVSDNPVATTSQCTSGPRSFTVNQEASASTYKNKWFSICSRVGTWNAGRYLLRVKTGGDGSAANRYAIKVTTTTAAKVRIAGYGDMSMYNNIGSGTSSADVNANFYLAEVDPVHKGKTFRVSMYDPGEVSKTSSTTGTGTVKVLKPDGTVAASCVGLSDSPNSTFTSGSTLSPCQFTSAVAGSAKYNGYWVTLNIPIPTTYSCTLGTIPGCWWKVRYTINGQANDTTTWAAQVIGDPVHLINPDT